MTHEDQEYMDDAMDHGFSESMAEFLTFRVSRPGHMHTVEQIEKFDDAVAEILNEELDEEDD